mmetsp:Transcript_30494/g.75785  ORF Transcript_30494/g.75785 Transcript_30494/m.75785 type:complete len:261 (-) Transcript_30494:1426-2208(-)
MKNAAASSLSTPSPSAGGLSVPLRMRSAMMLRAICSLYSVSASPSRALCTMPAMLVRCRFSSTRSSASGHPTRRYSAPLLSDRLRLGTCVNLCATRYLDATPCAPAGLRNTFLPLFSAAAAAARAAYAAASAAAASGVWSCPPGCCAFSACCCRKMRSASSCSSASPCPPLASRVLTLADRHSNSFTISHSEGGASGSGSGMPSPAPCCCCCISPAPPPPALGLDGRLTDRVGPALGKSSSERMASDSLPASDLLNTRPA